MITMSDEIKKAPQTAPLSGRGGPGRGQGRKPLSADEPTIEATISLPQSHWELLRELGGENASAGVRRLIDEHLGKVSGSNSGSD
jgi:hypothetical protein